MTEVSTSVAERNRVAWNLPRGHAAVPSQTMLDWHGFRARYFPRRGRHDFAALTAYGAYRASGGTAAPLLERLVHPQDPQPSAATPEAAWEDEGGSTFAASPTSSERGRVLPAAAS